MSADADSVFDVLSDLESMTTWLPSAVEIELSGPNLIRLWMGSGDKEIDLERQVRIDWDRLRVEWGGEATTSCTGWLQVLRLAPGRSAVTVEVSGPAGVSRSRVDNWVEEALDTLAALVATPPRQPVTTAPNTETTAFALPR
jgi:hypothetical protein